MGAVVPLAQGISWEPQITGIFAVLIGVVVLCGSVYLLLATNLGARLGLLLSLCAVFGFVSILSLYFWLDPPGIGPIGDAPYWEVEEIHVTGELTPPVLREAQELAYPGQRVSPEEILDEDPDLAEEVGDDATLSDIAAADEGLVPSAEELNDWRIVSTADAGESQSAADEALVDEGVFEDISGYEHLNVFATGGKTPVEEVCDDDDGFIEHQFCRAWHRVSEPFQTHPSHYAVVEVQAAVPQEVAPGEAPPTPIVDESQPAIWVIMERQLGTTRVLPFSFFVVSFTGFLFFGILLHYREKTLERNLEEAAIAKAEA